VIRQTFVHTCQHYDNNMSDVFFSQLSIPAPDVNLGVGSGSHAQQTAEIMRRFEPTVLEHKPDMVVVYGDVNSTMAAALVSAKLQIPVAHIEAGLRSFDRTMPEEVNRLVTDQLADLLFSHCEDADINLRREGVSREKIHEDSQCGQRNDRFVDPILAPSRASRTERATGTLCLGYTAPPV